MPVDLAAETTLDEELKSWLAFARQKLDETVTLARLLGNRGTGEDRARVAAATAALDARRASPRLHRPEVAERLAGVGDEPIVVVRPRQRQRHTPVRASDID